MNAVTVDVGTNERCQRLGGVRLGARIQSEGGLVTHQGAVVMVECLIDAMHQDGLFDGDEGTKANRAEVGRSRYEQAIWLRRLFMDAGLQQARAMDLNARSGGGGDIPDDVARERAKFNRVIRALGAYARATAAAVCYDERPQTAGALKALKQGLDALCYERG